MPEIAERRYTDSELIYAARIRCLCGAGMAFAPETGPKGHWECSAVLKGKAGAGRHGARFPLAFDKIRSEQQPSASGATTRP